MGKVSFIVHLFLHWLQSKLSRIQFLVFACIIVGFVSGLAGILLKTLVHYFHWIINSTFDFFQQQYAYLVFPLIGIFLTVMIVRYLFNGKIGKGVSNILYEIAQKSSFVHKDKMYSHIITSAITVGLGGSAGLESPIVVTGSAIGSNTGKLFELNYKDRTMLLASGAAAGIAAIFNAPITGTIFAIEVLLAEVSITEFIPLIIASVCGALTSKIILNENILFTFNFRQDFNYFNVPFYIILGLLCGFVSLYYARVTTKIEQLFSKMGDKVYKKAIFGGLILAGLCFIFPPLFGEGYESIKLLASGKADELLKTTLFTGFSDSSWYILLFAGMIIFIKVIATSVTLSSGGIGGNFAPSLFVGAYTGFVFSRLINLIDIVKLPESNFTMVGMAGILSGVMYAPLTGIFLIAEITGGYELMIPLMIVSALSFQLVKQFEPYSMDNKKLASKGQIFTADKDKNILTLLKINELLEKDIQTLSLNANLGDLVEVIKHSNRNIFAIIDSKNKFKGIITLDDVRELMFHTELYSKVKIKQIMKIPPAIVQINESMQSVMKKFDQTNSWNLPVTNENQYIGFISKSSIFTTYRNELINQVGVS